jgi:hypothetical protein
VEECRNEQLLTISKGYEPQDIYNADKTELCFKLPPNKALRLEWNPSNGGRNSKERIMLLLACNAHE